MDSPRMWENGLEFHWCSPCCVLINQELLLPSVLNMHTILSISSLDFKEVCVYGLSLFSPPPLLYSTFLCCWLWDLSEMQTGSSVSDPSACLLSLLSGSTVPSHTQPCMSSTWTPVGFPKNSLVLPRSSLVCPPLLHLVNSYFKAQLRLDCLLEAFSGGPWLY